MIRESLCYIIVRQMNAIGETSGIEGFSDEELRKCLNKHDSSYSNFRYFQSNRQGKLKHQWKLSPRDVQIMHCVASIFGSEQLSNLMDKVEKGELV